MDVRKVQDMRKNVEHQYITEDSKTRIYLSVVREFNENGLHNVYYSGAINAIMANLYNLCRKDGTVMEYSITASDIAKRIGCDRQDIYSSASYGLLIKKEYYVEITDRPLSWKKDIDLLTEYDNVRKKFLRRCGK